MFKSTLAGHPLHPIAIVGPAGLLPFSFVMDVMEKATGRKQYRDAARLSLWGGVLCGLAAAAAGAVDYFSLREGTEEKRTANVHAGMNVGIMAAYGLNLSLRDRDEPVGAVPFALSALGTTALLISAWYGGKLVYEHGLRVQGVDPLAGARDLKLPGDDQIKESLEQLEGQVAPATQSLAQDPVLP